MGLRFSMFSLGDDFFNSWCTKYQTFRKRNGNDLMSLKCSSIKKQNYEQCDEFIEYENFIDNSYHFHLHNYLKLLITLKQNQAKEEWTQTFCENYGKTETEELLKIEESKSEEYTRT